MAGRANHAVNYSADASRPPGKKPIRIGFVDLVDAAPLIVAFEHGFFADEALTVELERQLGWASIRDRLTFGQLDLAHALLGMPLFSQIGRDWFIEPLVAVMNLGTGGNAITLSDRLIRAGVNSAATFARYIRNDPRHEVLAFGHVFSCSMHHYLLREWLSAAGIDPDRDVRLRVFPPNQLAGHMRNGHIEGFCVGEPWNTRAEEDGVGRIIAVTTDIIPLHPEKVLAVSRRWMEEHHSILVALIRAILRACVYCDDEANHDALAELLSKPQYLDMPGATVRRSLELDRTISQRKSGPAARSSDWRMRSFATSATFPSKTHAAWLASQMLRWNHLPAKTDILNLANRSADSTAYRQAAAALKIACPSSEFLPMPLRAGSFDPLIPIPRETPVRSS